MKKEIYSKKAPKPIGPYSQAIKINNLIFISGQIGIDNETGKFNAKTIEEETIIIMKNINYILEEANCNFEDVVKTSIFLSKMTFLMMLIMYTKNILISLIQLEKLLKLVLFQKMLMLKFQ